MTPPEETDNKTPDVPYEPDSVAEKMVWQRIESDESRDRVYAYPGGETMSVRNVEWIAVTQEGAHRLRTIDGRCVYVLPGWRAIEWKGLFQF